MLIKPAERDNGDIYSNLQRNIELSALDFKANKQPAS